MEKQTLIIMLLEIEIDTLAAIGGVILIVGFLGNILYFVAKLIFHQFRVANDYFIERLYDKMFSPLIGNSELHTKVRFSYYNKLSEKMQQKFFLRVKRFIRSKKFTGRNGLVVTDEMKVMIASAAVQLTFGLRKYLLDNFSDIIIYPESYYSRITGKMHIGEANPRGILVISWKDFQRGYAHETDALNVGLHEMAHALELNKRLGGSFYDDFFSAYYEKWKLISASEYEKVNDDRESFFRSYAGTNRHEFFAVCIEYFFEAAEKFKKELPEMYAHLCVLLNQDPLNADFQISRQPLNRSNFQSAASSDQLPQYSTTFQQSKSLGIALLLALFLLVYSIYSMGQWTPLLALICLVSWTSQSVLKKLYGIELYQDHLRIVNRNGKIKSQFRFESVVLMDFDMQSSSLTVSTVYNTEISNSTFSFHSKEEELQAIKKILKEKKVPVKIWG